MLLRDTPIRFESAQQPGGDIYIARGTGWTLGLARSSVQFTCVDKTKERAGRIHMRLLGGGQPEVEGLSPLPGAINYFTNGQPARTGVQAFGRVIYRQAYPGIDLAFYGTEGKLEYDFIVAPGADPRKIRMEFSGAAPPRIDEDGGLRFATSAGDVVWNRPAIYQESAGRRVAVAGGFRRRGRIIGFEIAAYDRSQPLVIDPVLSYATYLGGEANEMARGIAVDSAGNIYVTGYSTSSDLKVTSNALQTAFGGQTTSFLTGDAYVAKYTPSGSLAYLTYLGGSGDDVGMAIAVDASGSAYVTGSTNSTNFPVTQKSYQTTFAGTGFGNSGRLRGGDAFVAKLNPTGTQLVYSTYLGGRLEDAGLAIAVDATGAALVAGVTLSQNFPTTAGVVQSANHGGGGQPTLPSYGVPTFTSGDAFLAKLNPAGNGLLFSTYLGGSGDDAPFALALDASGNIYVGGYTRSHDFPTTSGAFQTQFGGIEQQDQFFNWGDGWIAKLNPNATALIYSTYFGGTGDDNVMGLAVDAGGNVYITGSTSSLNLPVTAGALQSHFAGYYSLPFLIEQLFGDAYVAKLNPSGSGLVYCTYLGGSLNDMGLAIAVDSAGDAFVAGWADSSDFPVTTDAAQRSLAGDGGQQPYILFGDAFLTELDPTGSKLLYSTYFGGVRDDMAMGMALDTSGNVYLAGNTLSPRLPVTATAAQPTYGGAVAVPVFLTGDAFVAKYSGFSSSTNTPAPKLSVIANAASNATAAIAPGMIFVGYGSNLGPATLTYADISGGLLASSQSGIQVLFNGVPAPIEYVSANQLAGIVPYEVAGSQSVQVVVKDANSGELSAPLTVPVVAAEPGVFSADSSGHGQGAILNADNRPNSAANPAAKGSVIVIFVTGEGQTTPAGVDGLIAGANPPKPQLPVTVTIGGLPATVQYAAGAPVSVAGLLQVNAQMSSKVPSGNQPVVVKIGSFQSQSNLTVAVK